MPTLAPIAYGGLVPIVLGTIMSKLVNAVFGSEFGAVADAGIVTVSPPIFLAAAVAFGLLVPRDAAPKAEPTAST